MTIIIVLYMIEKQISPSIFSRVGNWWLYPVPTFLLGILWAFYQEKINDFMNNSSSNSKNYIPVNSSNDSDSSDSTFIGNAESKRFHRADCYLISQIKDSNRVYFSSHDSAVSRGYTPCGDCNP